MQKIIIAALLSIALTGCANFMPKTNSFGGGGVVAGGTGLKSSASGGTTSGLKASSGDALTMPLKTQEKAPEKVSRRDEAEAERVPLRPWNMVIENPRIAPPAYVIVTYRCGRGSISPC